MRKTIPLLAAFLLIGAGPASQPATKPATRPVTHPLRLRDDSPESVKRYFERAMADRERYRKQAPAELAEAKKALSDARSRNARIAEINEAKARVKASQSLLAEVNAPDWLPPVFAKSGELQPGWIGTPRFFRVRQVLDDGIVLGTVQKVMFGDVVDVGDCAIEGLETANLVDGSPVDLGMRRMAATVYKYTSVNGAGRTVCLLQDFDLEQHLVHDGD